MNDLKFTQFELLLLSKSNPVGTSLLLILAFISICDSELVEDEMSNLVEIANSTNHSHEIQEIISIAKSNDLYSLQLACEIIRDHFIEEKATLFLEMTIGMAVADRKLKHTENYFLRFLADLVNVSEFELKKSFFKVTNRNLPDPADLSSHEFWINFERKNNQQKERSSSSNFNRIRYLAILGLDENASIDEIKTTYIRLAKIHHPDKFVSLGEEAVQAANITFKRINEAYQFLVQNA